VARFEVEGQQLAGGGVGVQQALLDQPPDSQPRGLHPRGQVRLSLLWLDAHAWPGVAGHVP
jgi:hypothetical protein